jgi:hypothetical protein
MANALVLPADSVSSQEVQTVGGMPGVWKPGVAYLPAALGMSEDEARAANAAAGEPLAWTEVSDAETAEGEAAAAESSFEVTGIQTPTVTAVVEDDSARVASGGSENPDQPGWVEQMRARSSALAAGQTVRGPHELNQIARLEDSTKAQLLTEAEDAGLAPDQRLSKAHLVSLLTVHYFGGSETPAGEPAAAESDEASSEDAEEVPE